MNKNAIAATLGSLYIIVCMLLVRNEGSCIGRLSARPETWQPPN